MRGFFHGYVDCCRIFTHSCGDCIHDGNSNLPTYPNKHVHCGTTANPYVDLDTPTHIYTQPNGNTYTYT